MINVALVKDISSAQGNCHMTDFNSYYYDETRRCYRLKTEEPDSTVQPSSFSKAKAFMRTALILAVILVMTALTVYGALHSLNHMVGAQEASPDNPVTGNRESLLNQR